jgi:S1-C subfamily serine protease
VTNSILRLWPLTLIALVPVAAIGMFSSHLGQTVIGRPIATSDAVALIPGLTVENASGPSHGLVITSLRSRSAAAVAGLAVGDVVTAIDGRQISTLSGAKRYLHSDRSATIALKVVHDHHERRVDLVRNENGDHGA